MDLHCRVKGKNLTFNGMETSGNVTYALITDRIRDRTGTQMEGEKQLSNRRANLGKKSCP